MDLSKKQLEVISKIEHLLSIKLEVSAINRKTIKVKIEQKNYINSDLYVKIARICQKYELGRIEPNGINYIAIII
jgi:hypothetical protein